MAKQVFKTFSQVVPVSLVCWFPELNDARKTGDYGTEKEVLNLRSLLIEHGWRQTSHGTVDVEPISEHWLTMEMAKRETQYEGLAKEATTNAEKNLQLGVFRTLYCDSKGKIIEPKYLGISGNRRASVFFAAMVERFRKNEPISTEIPVVVYPANLSPMDRLEIQCSENEMRSEGAKEMTNGDRLIAARKCLQLGGKEATLSKLFKRGMSQKLWGIVRLDALWPDVHIVDRMCLPETAPGHIGWGVDKEVLRKLAIRSDPAALRDYNIVASAKGDSVLTPVSREGVEEYFGSPKVGKQNKPKMMDRDVIAGQSTGSPVKFVRDLLGGIVSNNLDPLSRINAYSVLFNGIGEIIEAGDGPQLELVVAKLVSVKNGARQELLKKLVDAVS